MKKGIALLLCLGVMVSGASASVIPKNMTLNLNVNLQGIFGGEEKEQEEEPENNTYGERVGGQSVHTETGGNDPAEQRNTEDMTITDESTATKDPLLDFINGLFGN